MIDEQLVRAWLGALAPRPKIAPSTFAEEQIILPPESPIPGPLRLAPYQKEPIDALADDNIHTVILMWSSQVGKSTIVNAMMAHGMANDPGPMLHVSPTDKTGIAFVKEKLDPLIASSPVLRAVVGTGLGKRKGSTGGQDSIDAKSFPGGQLSFASSFIAEELRARSIRYLFLDEVDAYALNVSGEGDPIALAVKRTKPFEGKRRKIVGVSTPTRKVGSRINQLFLRGDQRRFVVTCPDCGASGPISFDNLKWEEGKPSTAHLVCDECGVVQDEATRRGMIEGGKWVPTATGAPGIRSYHLDELTSLFSTLASVAEQFEAAKTPEQKQVFYNTTLAQVYDAGTEVELNSSELQQQAVSIVQPYSADVVFVTAGVDVQDDRLEVTYLAHHADGTHSVLNHLKLSGDPTGNAVWQELDRALGASFPLANGGVLNISATAVDTNYNVERALAFVGAQRAKARRTVPIIGKGGFERDPVSWGRRVRGQTQRLIVGASVIKREVQRRLARHDEELPVIRLPDHLPPEYFRGLAAEELRARSVKGFTVYEYHRTFKQNEPLDCLVYAMAVGKLLTPQRAKPAAAQAKPSSIQESAKRLAALSQPMR